jgi:hypothetical protein
MHNITLVCTRHRELGKCNSNELYQIIESINPDIIFEEVSPDLFDRFYKLNDIPNETLEIITVKRYLQNHKIDHIPVDIVPSPNLTTSQINYMFATFRKDDVYKKLAIEQYKMTESDGFAYLNSKKCMELINEQKLAEKNLMEFMMNEIQLSEIYKLFYEEVEKRENQMLQNIYDYSKRHTYDRAIFYTGTAHKKSIMQKIPAFESKENFKLNWIFYE